MAKTVLLNVLSFQNLVVGVPSSLPHQINVNGHAVIPQFIAADALGFVITADDVNVTVTRTPNASSGDVKVWVQKEHTIPDVEPPGGLAFPFVVFGSVPGAGIYASCLFNETLEPNGMLSSKGIAAYQVIESGKVRLTLSTPIALTAIATLQITAGKLTNDARIANYNPLIGPTVSQITVETMDTANTKKPAIFSLLLLSL